MTELNKLDAFALGGFALLGAIAGFWLPNLVFAPFQRIPPCAESFAFGISGTLTAPMGAAIGVIIGFEFISRRKKA